MADTFITAQDAAATLDGEELVLLSQLSTSITITAATISAAAADNSYNDSGNGFVAAGFAAGDRVRVSGFTGNAANNILVGAIDTLAAGKMTILSPEGDVIVDDAAGESVTISKWESVRGPTQEVADLASAGVGYEAGPPTPPTTADLATWDYQGTSTVTDGTGALILKPQVDGILHGRYKAAPATPYDVYCRVEQRCLSIAAVTAVIALEAGILFKDTGGDNERLLFSTYAERITGDEQVQYALLCRRITGATPPAISGSPIVKYSLEPWLWLHVNDDGTTLTFEASTDGKNWILVGTETYAAHIDAVASYGIGAIATINATEAAALFSYFSTVAPS